MYHNVNRCVRLIQVGTCHFGIYSAGLVKYSFKSNSISDNHYGEIPTNHTEI